MTRIFPDTFVTYVPLFWTGHKDTKNSLVNPPKTSDNSDKSITKTKSSRRNR
jgi:hypothetical protein